MIGAVMEDKQSPKVMVVCSDPWRDDTGNDTIPNLFAEWDPERIAVVYTKASLPETDACHRFFQISENAVVHTALHPGAKCGQEVPHRSGEKKESAGAAEEKKRYGFFRNHRWKIFYFARDLLWAMGSWKSKELDAFVDSFKPEVIFFPIYPYIYLNRIQSYIAKRAGVRGIAYNADDNYSYRPEWYNPLFLIQRFFLKRSIDDIMQYCDELLVIAPKLVDEYRDVFGVPVRVLTKGIPVDEKAVFEPSAHNRPLKMVYTGNLYIGRDKTVAKIVKALKEINREETKIQLFMYSQIPLTKKQEKELTAEGTSYFMGGIPTTQVAEVQKEADIVLFAEALDVLNRNKARLSFSTKLTDYFRSGKCIFAAGPRDIAPIDYLIRNDCALTACSEEEIREQLERIAEHPEILDEYGRRAFEIGRDKHNDRKMKDILLDALKAAAGNRR